MEVNFYGFGKNPLIKHGLTLKWQKETKN